MTFLRPVRGEFLKAAIETKLPYGNSGERRITVDLKRAQLPITG
jgi:hypothetical protein